MMDWKRCGRKRLWPDRKYKVSEKPPRPCQKQNVGKSGSHNELIGEKKKERKKERKVKLP
jgi:hypothetical protein